MDKSALEKYFSDHRPRIIEEYKKFLSFESVSTDPAYSEQCVQCVEWLSDHLKTLGFTTEVIKTVGKDLLFAERRGESPRSVLFYGHYDVQPVDPLNLWNSDPFSPVGKTESDGDERIYARGAQDNKGQLFFVLKAIEALLANGQALPTIKILIEGEEECGSEGIGQVLPQIKDKIQAETLLVCDTGTPDKSIGALTLGLRGIVHFEFRLGGLLKDLHSGVHGGMVKNPAVELAKLVAKLHDQDGRITIPHFYDDVVEVSAEDKARANAYPLTAEKYASMIGIVPTGGEKGYTPLERRGFRPTIEVNGIFGGYTGDGSKTIIPSCATVKGSARIVANQKPEKIIDLIVDYFKREAPPEMNLEVIHADPSGGPVLASSEGKEAQSALQILGEICPGGAVCVWEGASVPFIADLVSATGAQPILVGFGLEADNIHAPNESFSLDQFRKGFLFSGLFLQGLK